MLNVKYLSALIGLMAAIAFLVVFTSSADPKPVEESSCFYLRSLHYTANGMAHWYSKENGGLERLTGIPYRCVYQNFKDGQWLPIENPDKPLRQYVAFGQPLSEEQLEALARKQAAPVPKME
jgi:hypothetical protein